MLMGQICAAQLALCILERILIFDMLLVLGLSLCVIYSLHSQAWFQHKTTVGLHKS